MERLPFDRDLGKGIGRPRHKPPGTRSRFRSNGITTYAFSCWYEAKDGIYQIVLCFPFFPSVFYSRSFRWMPSFHMSSHFFLYHSNPNSPHILIGKGIRDRFSGYVQRSSHPNPPPPIRRERDRGAETDRETERRRGRDRQREAQTIRRRRRTTKDRNKKKGSNDRSTRRATRKNVRKLSSFLALVSKRSRILSSRKGSDVQGIVELSYKWILRDVPCKQRIEERHTGSKFETNPKEQRKCFACGWMQEAWFRLVDACASRSFCFALDGCVR